MNEQATNQATENVCSALLTVAMLILVFDRPLDLDVYLWWLIIAPPMTYVLALRHENKKRQTS